MSYAHQTYRDARGVALMPLIFIFAGLIVTVALAFSTISIAQGIATESEFSAGRALHYAESGMNDALMRLARDRTYRCPADDCYTISFAPDGCTLGNACAYVTVVDGASTSSPLITVRGTSQTNSRILKRDVTFDSAENGAYTAVSWCEEGGVSNPCL